MATISNLWPGLAALLLGVWFVVSPVASAYLQQIQDQNFVHSVLQCVHTGLLVARHQPL